MTSPGEALRRKNATLLQLEEAKALGDSARIMSLASLAAKLELELAESHGDAGRREDAAVNLVSAASCFIDCGQTDEAFQAYRRAFSITSKPQLKSWLQTALSQLDGSRHDNPKTAARRAPRSGLPVFTRSSVMQLLRDPTSSGWRQLYDMCRNELLPKLTRTQRDFHTAQDIFHEAMEDFRREFDPVRGQETEPDADIRRLVISFIQARAQKKAVRLHVTGSSTAPDSVAASIASYPVSAIALSQMVRRWDRLPLSWESQRRIAVSIVDHFGSQLIADETKAFQDFRERLLELAVGWLESHFREQHRRYRPASLSIAVASLVLGLPGRDIARRFDCKRSTVYAITSRLRKFVAELPLEALARKALASSLPLPLDPDLESIVERLEANARRFRREAERAIDNVDVVNQAACNTLLEEVMSLHREHIDALRQARLIHAHQVLKQIQEAMHQLQSRLVALGARMPGLDDS